MPKYDHECVISLLGQTDYYENCLFAKHRLKDISGSYSSINLIWRNNLLEFVDPNDKGKLLALTHRSRLYISSHGRSTNPSCFYNNSHQKIPADVLADFLKKFLVDPSLTINQATKLRVSLLVCEAADNPTAVDGQPQSIYNSTIGIASYFHSCLFDPNISSKRIYCSVLGRTGTTYEVLRNLWQQYFPSPIPTKKFILQKRYKYVGSHNQKRKQGEKIVYTNDMSGNLIMYDEEEPSAYHFVAHTMIPKLRLCAALSSDTQKIITRFQEKT